MPPNARIPYFSYSKVKTFLSCPTKYFFQYIKGWKFKEGSPAIEAGKILEDIFFQILQRAINEQIFENPKDIVNEEIQKKTKDIPFPNNLIISNAYQHILRISQEILKKRPCKIYKKSFRLSHHIDNSLLVDVEIKPDIIAEFPDSGKTIYEIKLSKVEILFTSTQIHQKIKEILKETNDSWKVVEYFRREVLKQSFKEFQPNFYSSLYNKFCISSNFPASKNEPIEKADFVFLDRLEPAQAIIQVYSMNNSSMDASSDESLKDEDYLKLWEHFFKAILKMEKDLISKNPNKKDIYSLNLLRSEKYEPLNFHYLCKMLSCNYYYICPHHND